MSVNQASSTSSCSTNLISVCGSRLGLNPLPGAHEPASVHASLRYQRDWSLRLAFKILLRTVFALFSSKAF